ncbi:MAG: bifunctional folylpolyglutamate synthase/dihydrofolate synthase [Rhodothermaceae bacterium]|nr:bifunctional folylpolyglutamate synthase/dihydrofolate synthase [Rhodothermaceae bacterium]
MNEAEQYLFSLPRFSEKGEEALKYGLERFRRVLSELGDPHRAAPIIHLAGTNGKGSTASYIASIATCLGARVGLHTSPHLFAVSERMRVDGKPAPSEWLARRIMQCKPVFDAHTVSFFEATVALSFLFFAEEGVDLCVIETGLGGRLDATNVVDSAITVITSIGYDHMGILGNTLEAIAREKSGIIKTGVPIISAVADERARLVVQQTALEKNAPFHDVYKEVMWQDETRDPVTTSGVFRTPVMEYGSMMLGLPGRHQFVNVAAALRVIETFFPKERLDVKSIHTGIRSVCEVAGLRGRLDVIQKEPLIVLDVSHNYDSLSVSLQYVKEAIALRSGHLFVAFGTMRDKDIRQMASLLAEQKAQLFVVPIHTDRALPPGDTIQYMASAGVPAQAVTNAQHALQLFSEIARPEDGLLITGSHLVVSQLPVHLLK